MQNKSQNCFVISPIGEVDSDTRKRSDQVLKHVIRPAVEDCGYTAVRADEIDKPGIITSQVIQHVVDDPLVIADLTERNPNVFYELAIRHALRKPLVQLIRKGETIPFDVAGTRTISVDHKDLDSVDAAKREIRDQIRSLEKDPQEIETPISVTLDLQLLRQSEKPEDRSLADLVAAVGDIRSSLDQMELRFGTKDQQGVLDELHSEIRRIRMFIREGDDAGFGKAYRGSRFYRGFVNEIVLSGLNSHPATTLLVVLSAFRDSAPWLYELGMELHKEIKSGDSAGISTAAANFRQFLDATLHHPYFREHLLRNKAMFGLMEAVEPLMSSVLEQIDSEESQATTRSEKAIDI